VQGTLSGAWGGWGGEGGRYGSVFVGQSRYIMLECKAHRSGGEWEGGLE